LEVNCHLEKAQIGEEKNKVQLWKILDSQDSTFKVQKYKEDKHIDKVLI